MENKRKKYLAAVLLIFLCRALCVLIYVFCLRQIPSLSPFSSYYREDYWAVYMIDLGAAAGVGICLAVALLTRSKLRQRICGVLMVGCIALYGVVLYGVGYGIYSIEWRVETLMVSLWPFITYGVAFLLKKQFRIQKIKGTRTQQTLAAGLYYLAILAVISFMQGMISSEFYRWEPLKMIYLMVVAALAWKLIQSETRDVQQGDGEADTDAETETVHQNVENMHKRDTEKWASVLTAWIPTVLTIAMLISNERVRDILESLKNPVTATQGVQMETNWLGNRLVLMMGAWHGDFSLLDEPFIAKIAGNCPLLWVDFVWGSRMAYVLLLVSLVLLGSLLLVLDWLQNDRKQPFFRLLGTALLLRSCIGIAADFLVLTTTDVGLLLLRNPGDLILVIYVMVNAVQFFRSGELHRSVNE